jgi:hypothetical protein
VVILTQLVLIKFIEIYDLKKTDSLFPALNVVHLQQTVLLHYTYVYVHTLHVYFNSFCSSQVSSILEAAAFLRCVIVLTLIITSLSMSHCKNCHFYFFAVLRL